MTDNKVTNLRSVPASAKVPSTPNELVQHLHAFVKEKELLSEWDDTDLELEGASGDETKIGPLNGFEKETYIVGTLLRQVMQDTMIDIEANGTDEIASIMREKRLNMPDAAKYYRENTAEFLDPATQAYLNQCALTVGVTMTQYEWSVRQRYDTWSSPLIVRSGFVAFTY